MTALADPQTRSYARIAGALYLVIAVSGGFAIAYVPAALSVPGDTTATLQAIPAGRALFLAGIGGDVIMMLAEIAVATMLYFMFRPVNPTLSAMALSARLMMVAVMAPMLFFSAAALALADGSRLATLSEAARADWLDLMLYLDAVGVWIWQLFFALHLALLGLLVRASGRFPTLLGWGLMIGSGGYALDSLQGFAFPDSAPLQAATVALLVIVTLAEIGFAFWLLLRGPRTI